MEILEATQEGLRQSAPADRYWAKEKGPELIRHLITRRDAYYRFVDRSRLFDQIIRLWRYYHGCYFNKNARAGDMELHVGGEDGEISLISVNHLRSILQLIVTQVTQAPPGWDAVAKNADHRSLQQASLGNQILDDVFERKRVERKMRRMVEHSLVLTAGYCLNVWDDYAGEVTHADVDQNALFHEGDVKYDNPTIFDVIHDYTIREWRQNQWFLIRLPENKWDLIARNPNLQEQILKAAERTTSSSEDRHRMANLYLDSETFTDQVDTWHFWHLPTASLPIGRHFCFVGSDTELIDEEYDNRHPPVTRMTAAELLMTVFGTTPGFDLMAPQELLNSEFSTIATNHNNFGQLKVWLKTGNTINEADLNAGMGVIQCEDKPETLNLLQTPQEIYETIKVVVQHMEYVSGANSVARGMPEASLKSGTALAVIDQKSLQSSEPLQASYYEARADIGTTTLKLYQKNMMNSRVIAIAGIQGRSKLKEFWAKDIEAIDRVRVEPGNSMFRNPSGRWQMAELLVSKDLVQNKQEILTFLDTGNLDPLTRADLAQLQTIHEENDAMENGEIIEAISTDNHVLHIREHHAVLDSVSKRRDPNLVKIVLGHIRHHAALMMDPESQIYQSILGYSNPFPAMPMVGGGPEGAPGAGGEGPGPVLEGGRPASKKEAAVNQADGQAPPGMNPAAKASMKNAVAQSVPA